MSSAAGWAALAGIAGSLGKSLQQKHDDEEQAKKDEQRMKLLQLQQDAEQKRQQFLIDYKVNAEQTAKDKEHERTKDDVVGQVTNPETGDVMGRTKSGATVPLVSTSDEFKAAKAAKLGAQVANTAALAANRQGANKGPMNPAYGTGQPAPDETPNDPDVAYDPTGKTPFSSTDLNFVKQYAAMRDKRLAAGKSDPNSNDPDIAVGDPSTPFTTSNPALARQLAAMRDKRLGGADMGQKQSTSPTQPQAPSMEQIIAEANAAIKRGAPQDAVEAKMKALMQQFGYQPQAPQ